MAGSNFMPRYLILKLDGPMQAWGGHSYEDFRPSHLFPTRSGLLGLIGACLGLERTDTEGLNRLSEGLEFAVRADRQAIRPDREAPQDKAAIKLADFHTVLDARKVSGKSSEYPVVSRREYLFDAVFTVAVGARGDIDLEAIATAVGRPRYTPTLGRRSCPLARPLFDGWQEAESIVMALAGVPPAGGTVYAEGEGTVNDRPLPIRDVPMHDRHRRFGTRYVYVHRGEA
jgi:CRISPR system Cascade subunit CasD